MAAVTAPSSSLSVVTAPLVILAAATALLRNTKLSNNFCGSVVVVVEDSLALSILTLPSPVSPDLVEIVNPDVPACNY